MELYRKYLASLATAMLLMLILVALLTLSIDPYGYFGMPRIEGLSAIKPASATRNRTVKPLAAVRVEPRTLILGNSRPELGIDPHAPVWPDRFRPVYNFGVPGAGVAQQGRYALLEGLEPSVRNIFWAVDFIDFLSTQRDAQHCHEGSDTISLVTADRSELQRVKDAGLALWSTRAVLDSVWTLLAQGQDYPADRTRLGFNPARDYWPTILVEGQQALFRQKNEELRTRLIDRPQSLLAAGCDWSVELASLLGVLTELRRRDISTYVFINPYHIDYIEIIKEAGLWPEFLRWQEFMVTIARRSGAELWDFSEPGSWHRFPVTDAAPGTALAWFWEPAHYRRELGDLMLAEMLGEPGPGGPRVGKRLVP